MGEDLGVVIGVQIRSARGRTNLNQKELAEKVGITAAAINQFESGKRKPSSTVLAKLAVELGVSTDFLLGATDEQETFVSKKVAAAFREFKELNPKDREIILRNIQFLKVGKK